MAEEYRDGQRLQAAQATATIAIASMLSGKPGSEFLPGTAMDAPRGKMNVEQLRASLIDFTIAMGGKPPT